VVGAEEVVFVPPALQRVDVHALPS